MVYEGGMDVMIIRTRFILKCCLGERVTMIGSLTRIMRTSRLLIEYVILAFTCLFLYLIHEQKDQTGKDLLLYLALLFLTFLIIFLRGISFRNLKIIIWFAVCCAVVFLYIRIRGIDAAHYGEVYSKVVWLKISLVGAFAFMLPDMIVRRPKLISIKYKSPALWLFVAAAVVCLQINRSYVIMILPMLSFLYTDIDKERWTELMDCLVLSLLTVFLVLFTRSLILKPNLYGTDGRYAGTFLNNSKIGELCGIALICLLYIFIRWFRSEPRNKLFIVPFIIIAGYVAYATHIVAGRAGELGVLLAIVCAFVFLNKKEDRKATKKRLIILLCLVILSVLSLVVMANVLATVVSKEIIEGDRLSYFMSHVLAMTEKESRGTYEPGTILDALDHLSSGRLTLWHECAKDIIWWGRVPEARLWTHSTYLYWFVGYGILGGIIIVAWFVSVIAVSIVETVKRNKAVSFTLIWVAFIAGFIFASNEYFDSIGVVILILLQYPLLRVQSSLTEGVSGDDEK